MAAMCLHERSKNNSGVLVRGLAGTNTKKPPEPMMTQAAIWCAIGLLADALDLETFIFVLSD